MFSALISFLFGLLIAFLIAVLGFFGFSVNSDSGFGEAPAAATVTVPTPATVTMPTPATDGSDTATPGGIAQKSGDMVDPAWLALHISDRDLRIIALSDADEFATAHIPGAVQVDWPAFEITETTDGAVASWEQDMTALLTNLSISPDSTVVVYDYGTHYSARVWWVLKALGHEKVYLLNGGFAEWEAYGLGTDSGNVAVSPATTAYVANPDPSLLATKADVEQALGDPNIAIVDARTPEEYAAGHIPGAINIPFTENYAADGTLLSPDELTALYTEAGVTPDKPVIVYCSTGVRAASDMFALTYLGYQATLYAGSYQEWSADPDAPIER
jgi:thiosulfate/3-mercaptopyruvate sulfurtransferase